MINPFLNETPIPLSFSYLPKLIEWTWYYYSV